MDNIHPTSIAPDHRSFNYCRRYNVSDETRDLDPAARFARVMGRSSIDHFFESMDTESMMDLDLLYLWQERQRKNAAIEAAEFAVRKIRAFIREIKTCEYTADSCTSLRPMCSLFDVTVFPGEKFNPDPKVFFPMIIRRPKYVEYAKDSQYAPQVIFWGAYRNLVDNRTDEPYDHEPLPITAGLRRMSMWKREMVRIFLEETRTEEEVDKFAYCCLKRYSRGYFFPPNNLQSEELVHLRNLLNAICKFHSALFREDLPQLLALIELMTDILISIRYLVEFGYSLRERLMKEMGI